MPVYVVLAALAVTVSVPILWFAVALDRAPTQQVNRNLRAGLAEGGDLRGLVLTQSPVERVFRPLLHTLGGAARRISPAGVVQALERRVELAGVGWPVERFLVLKLAGAGGLLTAGLVYASMSDASPGVLVAVTAAIVGYLAPDVVLSRKASTRQQAIANALPDTLDQLTICVEAGLGFDTAMARTSRSGAGPLSQEISRLLQDLRVGVPRAEALDALLARTDVPELRQFVHAVIQAETYGVPVSSVLRAQATEQREKRRFRAEERAMKLPVKVIFPLVFCILPVLFIVVISPAFLKVSGGL
ncbi:MAG TPA: type II secretion system F family protein [Acidimicrobiales bacterium]|nr:type II secretion system F family protein [Acidimicrobiales bacterium]